MFNIQNLPNLPNLQEEENKPEENAAPQSEGSKVVVMKEGEYQLHILIESARNIILEGYTNVDAMVEVTFNGVTKHTKVKKDVTPTTKVKFDEHIFFETGKLGIKEIEQSLIELRIVNKGFFSSDTIGYFPISTTTIYNLEKHAVHSQLIAMNNPTAEDKGKTSAILTISANLSGPGDESIQLKLGTEKEANSKAPWIPTSIVKQYKQFYFKFIKAENLPVMDTFGTIDAYIYFELDKKSKI